MKFIAPQAGQEQSALLYLSPAHTELIEGNPGLTMWAGSICLAAFGLVEIAPGKYIAWAHISRDIGRYMAAAIRKLRFVLDNLDYTRVEIRVARGFENGHRLAEILGFECEAPIMRKSGTFNQDETLYARIK